MKKYCILLLISSLLSACGGSSPYTPSKETPPKGKLISTQQFINLTINDNCADIRNRLIVIDEQYVLWDKSSTCKDASYAQVLYGSTPNEILCQNTSSIAGTQKTCSDKSVEGLFSTIINHLDEYYLGLNETHTIRPLSSTSGSLASLFFYSMNAAFYRGSPPLNLIIKDSAKWNDLLKSGTISPTSSNLSVSDFQTNSMVLGTFFKSQNDCSQTQIVKLITNGQKLTAEYRDEERMSISRCDPNSLPSTPMNLVHTSLLEMPIEFINVSKDIIDQKIIDQRNYSNISVEKNIVVKDQQTWLDLWKNHKNNNDSTTPPEIDFTKSMIIGIFLGQHNRCEAVGKTHAWISHSKLNIANEQSNMKRKLICLAVVTSPSLIIEIPKNQLPIEFSIIPIDQRD